MMTGNSSFKVARLARLDRDDSLKAMVDVVVNDNIMIRGIKVVEGKNGIFVGMPGRKDSNGKWYDNVHPVTKEAREELQETVLSAYETEK